MATTIMIVNTETETTVVDGGGKCYNGNCRNSLPAHVETNGSAYQITDKNMDINATGIAGNVQLIHTNTRAHWLNVYPTLRNQQYVYMPYCSQDSSPYNSDILEYNILGQNSEYLNIGSGTNSRIASDFVSAALIEERKLFVIDSAIVDGTAYKAYIMDFEADTVTLELTEDNDDADEDVWLRHLCTVKDMISDIHLIGICDIFGISGDYCGIKIWHKNYTQAGAWVEASVLADTENGTDVPYSQDTKYYTVINNRYVVIFSEIYYTDGAVDQGIGVYVYDIVTQTMDYTAIYHGDWEEFAEVQFISIDHTNNKCYFYGSAFDPDSDNKQHIIEFNPIDMSYSNVYTGSTDGLWLFTSNTHSYFYDDNDDSFYQSSNQALKFNYTLPVTGHEKVCYIMDDGDGLTGELLWFLNTTTKHLYSIDMSGNVVDDLTLTITLSNHTQLFHLGNILMVITYDDVSSPKTMKYHLIT